MPSETDVPGHAVSGCGGVLALHTEAGSSSPDSARTTVGFVLTQLIHAGLSGHVEPHGLLVVNMDTLPGRHVTLAKRKCDGG